MLVLQRTEGETVEIYGGPLGTERILVKVVSIKGDRIRLGFECPRNIRVDRSEVVLERERETLEKWHASLTKESKERVQTDETL